MIIDLTTKVSQEKIDLFLKEKAREERHIATGHIGTHLDNYSKTEIPLEYFKRLGILIDVSDISEQREVEISDILDVEIKENSFVIFRTARIEKHEYGTKEYFENHPQLSHALIDYLVNKKISFIGIDCAGIRRGDEHAPADVLCEKNGVYVIENLCQLEQIAASTFIVYTMWLDDEQMTGLKCRVLIEQ